MFGGFRNAVAVSERRPVMKREVGRKKLLKIRWCALRDSNSGAESDAALFKRVLASGKARVHVASEAAIAEHARLLDLWRKEQKQLLARHAAAVARESVRHEAVKLQDCLTRITFEMNNQTAIAEGRFPGQVAEGGLFRVGEDLFGTGPLVRPQG